MPPSRRRVAETPPSSRPLPREELRSVEIDDVLDGKYRLVDRLDEGGMGSVFVGHNQALDVPVAVKVIRSDIKDESKRTLGERLLQEARAAARLGHPAIVRMLDFGIAPNGDPYLIMELLDGEDLATALDQRGRVNPAKAVRLLLPIIHALATAHDKGIVHRDLKPDNIILAQTEGGQVQPKLIDFGIAKLHHPRQRRITQLGDALGTPEYMSPQAARGEDVDAQADIWAVSVLLYEMVTGTLPFDGHNYHALLRAIIEDEPEPISNLGVQAGALWQIIKQGLAKNTSDRWPSMRDMGAALAEWLIDQGVAEDICGASLNATWLKKPSYDSVDVLASIPPADAAPASTPAVEIVMSEPPKAPRGDDSDAAPTSEAQPAQREPPSDRSPPVPSVREPEAEPPASVDRPAAVEAVPDSASAEGLVQTAESTAKPQPVRRSWGLYGLWLLALVGVAWAVTGYFGVSLPGLPARLATPAWMVDWLGAPPATDAAATGAPAVPGEPEPSVSLATDEPAGGAAPEAAEPPDAAVADAQDAGDSEGADAAAEPTATAAAEPAAAKPPSRAPARPRAPHHPKLKRPTFD